MLLLCRHSACGGLAGRQCLAIIASPESGIAYGRFSNASDAVREGLRLLEQREREDQAKIE
jgi:hypothetical protein